MAKATKAAEAANEATELEVVNGSNQETSQDTSRGSGEERTDEEIVESESKTTAKAGKRSAKALKEAEEKAAKEERKLHAKEEGAQEAPKPKQVTRTRLERRGKKFRKAAEQIDSNKVYSLKEAIELATKTSTTKFDATVELHINLNVDPKHADQNVRDNLVLPNGTGKEVRVAVFADADQHAAANKAGADIVGADDFLQQLEKGVINFDILIATPQFMAKLGKYARLLGPKGLMPNPKSGTVTPNVAKAVEEAKAGKVEYRVDSAGIVHIGIGKVSFGTDKLLQNAQAIAASVKGAKPATIKGVYIGNVHVTTSMGPSIKVASSEL